jgi:iron complex transport system substrate-binding protein
LEARVASKSDLLFDPEKKADDIYKFLLGKGAYDDMKRSFGGYGPMLPMH